MLLRANASHLPLRDETIDCCVTSPPYWGLRDYGVPASVWGGSQDCSHVWGEPIQVNATNHTDKRRWNHTRNGRDEEQPIEKRVAWLRTVVVDQGSICVRCGGWRGKLGLEPTPELFTENIVAVFREVRRVLKPSGTLWLNIGDSYASGAGRVGEHPGGGQQGQRWKGRGVHTADASGKQGYRIASMGPMTQPNRMPIEGLKPKDLVGIPWRVAFALQADGWYLRSDIIWSKPNPMPESVTDRPTKSHEYLFLLAKSERYGYDAEAIAEPTVSDHPSGNGFVRPERLSFEGRGQSEQWQVTATRNRRTVWTVNTQPYTEAHFATFPEALVEPCILAGCPLGGLTLDPFIGSGTVGQVAERLGRRWVGVDLGYHDLAKKRTAQRGLFTASA